MKNLISFLLFILVISFANAQPCKVVKEGMTKDEVIKLCGPPTEIDSLGATEQERLYGIVQLWMYKDSITNVTQRIEFMYNVVEGDVIADVFKYDQALYENTKVVITQEELKARMEKVNREACK